MYCHYQTMNDGTSLGISKIISYLYGTAQYKQYITLQHNTIQYNTIQYNTIQYNTIPYNTTRTIQHITIQYGTVKYNATNTATIQYNIINTVQYNISKQTAECRQTGGRADRRESTLTSKYYNCRYLYCCLDIKIQVLVSLKRESSSQFRRSLHIYS